MKKPKIIYILSTGHSGSTLLNNILAGAENTFSVGELKFLKKFIERKKPLDKKNTPDISCDCNKSPNECPFWKKIIPKIDVKKLVKVKDKEKKGTSIKEDEKLYKLIYSQAKNIKGENVEYIIDSSKDLNGLRILKKMKGFDVKVISLTRDGRGVINSHEREGFNWLRYYLVWLRGNILNRMYLFSINKKDKIKISYDLFTKDPKRQLEKIKDKFNIDINTNNYIKKANDETIHSFAGNIGPRRKKLTEIKHDQKWKREMPKWKQIILTILCYIPNRFWVYNKKLK